MTDKKITPPEAPGFHDPIWTTVRPEDHAAFLRALNDAEPTDDLVALMKQHAMATDERSLSSRSPS